MSLIEKNQSNRVSTYQFQSNSVKSQPSNTIPHPSAKDKTDLKIQEVQQKNTEANVENVKAKAFIRTLEDDLKEMDENMEGMTIEECYKYAEEMIEDLSKS